MAILKIEDKSGRIEATVFPKQWNKIKDHIKEDTVNIIRGTVNIVAADSNDVPPIVKIFINEISLVGEDSKTGQIHPLNITLKDTTEIELFPHADTNYVLYQQALAVIQNMKRMK